MTAIKHIIEYAFLRTFIALFKLLPYRSGQYLAGRILGNTARLLGASQRRKVMENLKNAFPDQGESWRKAVMKETYYYLGQLVFEFVYFEKVDQKWLDQYVEIEPRSLELLTRARDAGKGIILVAAHLGNWEILNQALIQALGLEFHVYAAPQSNPYASRYVFTTREKSGMKLLLPSSTGIHAIRLLKRGGTLGLVADQNARKNGLFIPFLGRPASIFQGPGIFAYHSGAETFFIVGIRLPEGRFRIEVVPLGRVTSNETRDVDEFVVDYTLRWVDLLEKYVHRYPEQYFWFHNRWKTKPGPTDPIHTRIQTELEPVPVDEDLKEKQTSNSER